MTSPADMPPPEPGRGDPVRLRWFWGLFFAACVFVLAGSILIGAHVHHYTAAIVSAFGAAVVSLLAAFLVLATGKGEQ